MKRLVMRAFFRNLKQEKCFDNTVSEASQKVIFRGWPHTKAEARQADFGSGLGKLTRRRLA